VRLVVFTYIGALLRELTGFGEIGVSVMLFFFGIAGVAGNALGGYDAGRWGYWRILATILRHSHPLPVRLLASDARSRLTALPPVPEWRWSPGAVGRQERDRWALMPFQQYRPIDLAPRIQNVVLSANASSIYLGQGIGAGLCYFAILYGSLTSLSWVATL
jgi:predicted MFS family arabinose efflux permease